MSDYTRLGDYAGHNLEETQLLAYCPRGVACYGCSMCVADESYSYGNGMMMVMPGSPVPGSPSSDCSASTASLDEFLSPPASPFHSEDSCSSFSSTSTSSTSTWTRHARPAKSSLRRAGSSRQQRRVTWDPDTVFETRPLLSKRRRALMEAAEHEEDADLAPAPTKRAKLAEPLDSQANATHRSHIAPASSQFTSSMQTLCPELARSVVPCFDFSSCLAITMTKQNTSSTNATEAKPTTPSTAPTFVSFTIAKPKAPLPSSLLSKA